MTLYKFSLGNTDDLRWMFRVLQHKKKGVNILYKK